jgi:UDP-N-acetylglucosamine 1-carboxyvinyltransferase
MSKTLVVTGGKPLKGTVQIVGAKNAASKELVACLLADEPVTLTNVPQIGEVDITSGIIEHVGAKVTRDGNRVVVDATGLSSHVVTESFSGKNRIPILLLGPLLARFGKAEVPALGGDRIGARPVDFHIDALQQMGAEIMIENGTYKASAPGGRLHGAVIELPYPSVGATENVMLAAVRAKGITVIKNAATEPEIVDLAKLLQSMGAIINLEVNRTWVIEGVKTLGGATHRVVPDRIVAGSFAVAAAITKGDVTLKGINQEDMLSFLNALRRTGVPFEVQEDSLRVTAPDVLKPLVLETDVHPGFMTDWQQPFVTLLTQAQGVSIVHETVYESRFGYTEALNQMGSNITIHTNCLGSKECRFKHRNHPHSAVIVGPTPLKAGSVDIPDLRAGFSYLIAALIADGESRITGVEHIERGYEHIVDILKSLGAQIEEA